MTASGRCSRRRSRSRARPGAWSSWSARPGSARPRSSPSVAGDRHARAVGRLRPADHAAPDGPAARRRARGRRRAGRGGRAARARTLLAAVLDELRAPAPCSSIEDLHWADDATLDLVALLGRRLPRSRGCLILTCRPRRARPRCGACSAALPRECVRRIEPGALSEDAVALLARARRARRRRPARGLRRQPVLRHRGAGGARRRGVPASVRDAVALRASARSATQARAVVELRRRRPGPGRAARSSRRDRAPAPARSTSASTPGCCSCAATRSRSGTTSRAARSRTGSRRCAGASSTARVLARARGGGRAPTRRGSSHHARRAGDADGDPPARARRRPARRPPPAATGRRSSTGRRRSRRPAAATPRRSRASPSRPTCAARMERALEARRALLALHEAAGDALRAGDDLRWLSRILWWAGDGPEAAAAGDRGDRACSRRSRTAASWRWR